MTDQDLINELAAMDKWVVAQVNGRDVTRGELSKHFDLVADKTNWKFEINATLQIAPQDGWNVSERLQIIREAVIFFTGSVPSFDTAGPVKHGWQVLSDANGMWVNVRAAGYYQTIGA